MAKIKCANPITERIYGLEFNKGVSEEFDDIELLDRLLAKGYELVETSEAETAEETKAEETKAEETPVEAKKNSKKK